MTRSEMAAFIRKIAEASFGDDEWSDVMVNHYPDIPTENARRQAVKVALGYSDVSDDEKREYLLGLANGLEQLADDNEFYFHSMAVGILSELPPSEGECKIGYESYRGDGHYQLQSVLKDGQHPICEFMQGGQRLAFTVTECLSDGRLMVRTSI